MNEYWVCLQTVVGRELQSEQDLISLGYEVYLPRKLTDLRTRRKTRVIVEALYPSYMFLKVQDGINGTDLHPVKRVARIIQFGQDIAKASDALIEALKSLEDGGVHQSKHEYAEGDRVRFKSGALRHYEAVIQKVTNSERAILETLTGTRIEAPLIDLEPAA